MKTEAEQALPMDTAAVWAEEPRLKGHKPNPPSAKLMLAAATSAMFLTIGGCVWLYMSGLQTLHALTAQNSDNSTANPAIIKVVNHANQWALQMGLAAIAGGAGLFLVSLMGSRLSRRKWETSHAQVIQEVEAKAERLLGQLADAKVLEEESRKACVEAGQRLAEVSNAHTTLQRELDQRKQAEKSLAQQTQQLERSKTCSKCTSRLALRSCKKCSAAMNSF